MKLLSRTRLDPSKDKSPLLTLLDTIRYISLSFFYDIESMKPDPRPPLDHDPNRLFLFLLGSNARCRRNDTRRHEWIPIVIPE